MLAGWLRELTCRFARRRLREGESGKAFAWRRELQASILREARETIFSLSISLSYIQTRAHALEQQDFCREIIQIEETPLYATNATILS